MRSRPLLGVILVIPLMAAILWFSIPSAPLEVMVQDPSCASPAGIMSDAIAEAVRYVHNLHEADSYWELKCPKEQQLGGRPGFHTPKRMGTPCEPWLNRGILQVLSRVLSPHMEALEWSTGSSSSFLLRHVHKLTSIEHEGAWMENTRKTINNTPGLGEFVGIAESDWGKYIGWPAANMGHRKGMLDYVSVDGRKRNECLEEAIHMVRQRNGIVLLDNSDRPEYDKSIPPSHWPTLTWCTCRDLCTTIWYTCDKGDDVCADMHAEWARMETKPHNC